MKKVMSKRHAHVFVDDEEDVSSLIPQKSLDSVDSCSTVADSASVFVPREQEGFEQNQHILFNNIGASQNPEQRRFRSSTAAALMVVVPEKDVNSASCGDTILSPFNQRITCVNTLKKYIDRSSPNCSSAKETVMSSSFRHRPPVTVLMPYKHHSPITSSMHEKRSNSSNQSIKFKPFTSQEKDAWLHLDIGHGFVRIYEPNLKELSHRSTVLQKSVKDQSISSITASVVVPCTLDTTCRQICDKLGIADNELHAILNGDTVRRLDPLDKPLRVQNAYLINIGLTDVRRQQECGDSLDLCYLIKFCAGRPVINDEFGRSTLSSYCHVRKGRVFHHWTKRLCVLNNARLLVYPDLDRTGTPDVIALSRAKVEDVHLRSRGRCIKITLAAPRRPVQTFYIAFDSAVDLNTWLSRCLKGSAKVPPISDLSNLQLEYLPEQVFCIGSERLLTQLNLRRNCLKNRPPNENSFTIGWLDDLPRLESLRSLNLADNDLRSCPAALFQLNALTELVLSGNKLSEIPSGIAKLRNLQTLNLQNNWLSRLPAELAECESLSSLDLSFNRFTKIPEILSKLPLIEQWILNGNDIERFIDEPLFKSSPCIRKIDLRRCRLVQNAITTIQVGLLPLLTHLDIRDNRCITSLDLKSLPTLQVLSCQRCSLYDLQLNGSALTCLFASKNNLRNLVIMPVPKQLKVFDVSHNNLNKLPEWLTELGKIEKIIASHNRLTSLPHRIFTSVSSIKALVLHHNNIVHLPNQVENCFIELLDLHHNKLSQLPIEFLASAHKLRILNLSENLLTCLPALNPFLDLNKVQQLYLACNRLTDDAIEIISGYRRLRVLDLAYNCIRNLDDTCMEKLQLLESVNISGNRLQCLPQSLTCLPNLVVLRAHSNRLISLPDFSRAPCLKVLDCGSNQLEMIDVRHLLSPQLKHLDVSCNPRLRLDTSAFQQFRSERLVSLIDMSRETRAPTAQTTNDHPNPVPASIPANVKPPWQAGFSETSGERNKLCITQIRCPVLKKDGMKPGALFAIIDGGLNNELPLNLASKLPDILRDERLNQHTTEEYMKYALLKAHQQLQTSGQKMGASCTLCHMEEQSKSPKTFQLRVANCGHTEAVLCRKGRTLILTKRFLVEDASVEETERIRKAGAILTEENEVNGITPCSRLLGCNFLYPAVIPCPHVVSLELQAGDEFLLIASRGLWEVMDETEAVRRIRRITNPILAAKHLQDVAQSYGYKENLSILVVRFLLNSPTSCNSDTSNGTRKSTAAPSAMNPRRKSGIGPVMSAINVADSDEYSLTSDEDVKSEPRDTKLIREPPNYYFEYKKQLKQLMLEAGSSDAFSIDDGPESLYSVATLVCDERRVDDDPDEQSDETSSSSSSYEHEVIYRRGFDDGYQSSEMASSKPMSLNFGANFFAENLRSQNGQSSAQQQDTAENGDCVIAQSEEKSPSSSCSSGLGKSSTSSPNGHPSHCEHHQIQDQSQLPRWRIADQEALQDAKQRFQQARSLILAKLSNDSTRDERPQPHVARIAVLGEEANGNSDEFRRNSCPICSSKGDGIDVALSTTDFTTSLYETPISQRHERQLKRQAIYEKISYDDTELGLDDLSASFQGEPWPTYPTSAHSDDQIQCSGQWEHDEDHECTQLQSSSTRRRETLLGLECNNQKEEKKKYPTLIVANIDIDGSGPQNVIICDPDVHMHKLV